MLGDRIKKERISKDITQLELSKVLEVSTSTVGMYEQNRRSPDNETLTKLAKYFNVSTDYLLGNSDIKNPYSEDSLPDDFNTPEEAMDFLLNKNVIMGFTGFDIHSLTDEEKTQYARDLLDHLKLLSLKYKK
ncbi:MAG: helix-turn-helix transcriptional regulator [Gudongella sp.]|nr:helix-turn-helix transcriptional regulator [Gudongella sp.]